MVSHFLDWQLDYIYFIYGLAFTVLAAVCFTAGREEAHPLPWVWLGWFGAVHGLNEWLDLLALGVGDSVPFYAVRVGVLAASFVLLAEFGRAGVTALRGRGPGRWLIGSLLALAAVGVSAGLPGVNAAVRYLLGLSGGLWAAAALLLASRIPGLRGRNRLAVAGLALGLYALVAGAVVPGAPFFPASLVNYETFSRTLGFPVQLLRGLLATVTAGGVWCFLYGARGPLYYRGARYAYTAVTALVLVLSVACGWLLTRYLDLRATTTLLDEGRIRVNLLADFLERELQEVDRAAATLAESPPVAAALVRPDREIAAADELLDHYRAALGPVVCYLIDRTGVTIASSNRREPDSFVGRNYGFHPYFQRALAGEPGRHFALDVASGLRGYYASRPVRDAGGNIVGVAVIKKNVDYMEEAFRRYPYWFLVDPGGVVFMAGQPGLVFTNLWPVAGPNPQGPAGGGDMEEGSVRVLLAEEPLDGTHTRLEGRHFLVTRRPISLDGWSLVVLTPGERIRVERLVAILITLAFCLLSLSFHVGSERLARSAARIAASEANYRAIFDAANDAIFVHDPRTGAILDANPRAASMFGWTREELRNLDVGVLSAGEGEYGSEGVAERLRAAAGGTPQLFEWLGRHRDGRLFWVEVNLRQALIGGEERLLAVVRDIDERKRAQEQLRYLSLHDFLTGLYNRSYFEQEMRTLGKGAGVGFIVCDVDGLKLVNDSLGHDAGDRLLVAAAEILRRCLPEGAVASRIGGDEFAALIPGGDAGVLAGACGCIRKAVADYNAAHPELPLSLSVGQAYSDEVGGDITAVFRAADDHMYREKLHSSRSARSALPHALTRALEARDFLTEGHAHRLQELVTMLARHIGLPEHKMVDLRLLAQFHDLGKIGIPDHILFKPGPLTLEEAAEMRRHCEIGYRIALAAPDLAPIADWILKHHEWWNGGGYPLGLKGEEIPLECRILAIADAYDAMTSDRPYRKALTHEQAVAELLRGAGTQFDPRLVEEFVRALETDG